MENAEKENMDHLMLVVHCSDIVLQKEREINENSKCELYVLRADCNA